MSTCRLLILVPRGEFAAMVDLAWSGLVVRCRRTSEHCDDVHYDYASGMLVKEARVGCVPVAEGQ